MACTDCGVRPRWPITGISASTIASIIGRRLRPPSSFTPWAPARISAAALRDGVVGGDVVAHPRQVGDDERLLGLAVGRRRRQAPGDGAGVVGQVVDGDLQGVVVAEHDHGDGVADEDQVDAGLVGHAGAGRVVGRDHHERRLDAVTDLAGPDGGRGELRAHLCTS